MEKYQFQRLLSMAKSMLSVDSDRSDFWYGFQRGIRRLYHGENFGTQKEHITWLNCRDGKYRMQKQTGYRTGFYYDDLKIDSADDIQPIRKLLGLTVADMAKIAAVSPRTVEGWEQGRLIPAPTLQLIRKYLMI